MIEKHTCSHCNSALGIIGRKSSCVEPGGLQNNTCDVKLKQGNSSSSVNLNYASHLSPVWNLGFIDISISSRERPLVSTIKL